jgi:hypothetical protein
MEPAAFDLIRRTININLADAIQNPACVTMNDRYTVPWLLLVALYIQSAINSAINGNITIYHHDPNRVQGFLIYHIYKICVAVNLAA